MWYTPSLDWMAQWVWPVKLPWPAPPGRWRRRQTQVREHSILKSCQCARKSFSSSRPRLRTPCVVRPQPQHPNPRHQPQRPSTVGQGCLVCLVCPSLLVLLSLYSLSSLTRGSELTGERCGVDQRLHAELAREIAAAVADHKPALHTNPSMAFDTATHTPEQLWILQPSRHGPHPRHTSASVLETSTVMPECMVRMSSGRYADGPMQFSARHSLQRTQTR